MSFKAGNAHSTPPRLTSRQGTNREAAGPAPSHRAALGPKLNEHRLQLFVEQLLRDNPRHVADQVLQSLCQQGLDLPLAELREFLFQFLLGCPKLCLKGGLQREPFRYGCVRPVGSHDAFRLDAKLVANNVPDKDPLAASARQHHESNIALVNSCFQDSLNERIPEPGDQVNGAVVIPISTVTAREPFASEGVIELTTPEILSRLGVQIFRIENTSAGLAFASMKPGPLSPLGGGFGGYGCDQMFVTDLNHDGRAELVYRSTWGSGVDGRTIAFWEPGMQEPLELLQTCTEHVSIRQYGDGAIVVATDDPQTGRPTGYGQLVWDAGTGRPMIQRSAPTTVSSPADHR